MTKLAAYGEAIGSGAHKRRWGVPNLLVLTLTTSEARLAGMLRQIPEGIASAAFLFKAVRERDLTRLMPELVVEPWARARLPPLSLGGSS